VAFVLGKILPNMYMLISDNVVKTGLNIYCLILLQLTVLPDKKTENKNLNGLCKYFGRHVVALCPADSYQASMFQVFRQSV